MAISAYTGLPASGKSFGVVQNVIIPALKDGQKVFTNIPMKTEYCLKTFGSCVTQFDTQDIIDNADWWTDTFEAGAILVIDELWRLWPAGLASNKARIQDAEFLAEHRHLVNQDTGKSTNICFVTQDLAQIANFARLLVDKTFRATKLDAIGAAKRFRVDIYQGVASGPNPPDKNKINQMFYKYKSDVYDAYISHTKSEIVGDEERDDDRFNFLKSTKFKFLMMGFLIPLIVLYKAGSSFTDTYFSGSESKPEIKPVESQVVPGPGNENPALAGAVEVVKSKKPKFTFLSDQDNVYISFNMGVFPDLKYLITVQTESIYKAEFNEQQLALLDYELIPISTCAVRIHGPDFDQVVLCRSNERKQGMLERSVAAGTN